jgi:hypothetical protein
MGFKSKMLPPALTGRGHTPSLGGGGGGQGWQRMAGSALQNGGNAEGFVPQPARQPRPTMPVAVSGGVEGEVAAPQQMRPPQYGQRAPVHQKAAMMLQMMRGQGDGGY